MRWPTIPGLILPARRGEAGLPGEALRYATRLASAVLIAFATSALLSLPEGFWAVMSALIVVRPSTGSTLDAGWDRVRGAVVGTVLGLLAVGARHLLPAGGADTLMALAVVTGLAFAAGLTPALRSAPISGLIVVTSTGIAGHSAGQVALLRALEIGIGVAAAMLVSLLDRKARATRQFRVDAASLLHQLAAELVEPAAEGEARQAADDARRAALRRLAGLAVAADRETSLLQRRRDGVDGERHRKSARLLSRTAHDVAVFRRLQRVIEERGAAKGAARADASEASDERRAADRQDAERTAARLRAVADALAGVAVSPGADLPLAGAAHAAMNPAAALIAEDLRALLRAEVAGTPAP